MAAKAREKTVLLRLCQYKKAAVVPLECSTLVFRWFAFCHCVKFCLKGLHSRAVTRGMNMASNRRVVVIAGFVEGVDALARLTNSLPAGFSAPVVAYVHGLHNDSTARLIHAKLNLPSTLKVVFAQDREKIQAGYFYVAPVGQELTFTGLNVLGCAPPTEQASADHLFETATFWHGAETIGVILSGVGNDGVRGFESITEVGGTRVVQSPSEASFTAMPSNALMGDDVQHSVVLDQMKDHLQKLLARSEQVSTVLQPFAH
jgi:two-component system chemotaxis response regulator CheB